MKTMDEIKSLVREKVGESFRDWPVVVQESPEDSTTLWVQVFAVPPEEVGVVRGFILETLQNAVLAERDVILLAMVKNLVVTEKHYPQHMPRRPEAVPQLRGRWLAESGWERQGNWTCVSAGTFDRPMGLDVSELWWTAPGDDEVPLRRQPMSSVPVGTDNPLMRAA